MTKWTNKFLFSQLLFNAQLALFVVFKKFADILSALIL